MEHEADKSIQSTRLKIHKCCLAQENRAASFNRYFSFTNTNKIFLLIFITVVNTAKE